MKRCILVLLAVTAGTASAQLSTQTMVGRPLIPRILPPRANEPTLPHGRPLRPQQPTKPRNVIYVPAPVGYYYDSYYRPQQRANDVTVNVTNVINQPAPLYYPSLSLAASAAFSGHERMWNPEESIASESNSRGVLVEGRPARDVDLDGLVNREDVVSLESLIAAYYDVHSGPRGTARNWDRFATLFSPDARLTRANTELGSKRPMTMTPDDYRSVVAVELERGVFAREVSRKVERFGSIAQVFSTYEYRRMVSDPKPFARGINSMQLVNDGSRWWINSISWDEERAGNPIPTKYLTPARN